MLPSSVRTGVLSEGVKRGSVHPLSVMTKARSRRKPDRRTCGIYVLSPNRVGGWRVLVHRRSLKVSDGKGKLATPGGAVEVTDDLDDNGDLDEAGAHKRAICREFEEEAGIEIPDLGSLVFYELDDESGPYHKNFILLQRRRLNFAAPQAKYTWECIHNGVRGLGEDVPGGYYAWIDVAALLDHPDLWSMSKLPLQCIHDGARRTETAVTNPVSARVGSTEATRSVPAKAAPGSSSAEVDPLKTLPPLTGRVCECLRQAYDFKKRTVHPPVCSLHGAKPYDVLRQHCVRCRV